MKQLCGDTLTKEEMHVIYIYIFLSAKGTVVGQGKKNKA